jgi:DNA-3-methyladenine glycosylase II
MMSNDTFSYTMHLVEPFDLELTTGVARRLPSNILYPIRDGELRIVMALDDGIGLVGVRQSDSQTLAYRELGVVAPSDARRAAMEANLRRLLGLDVDITPLVTLLAHDPILAPLAHRLSGLRPPRFLNLWETFVQVIPFQQVSLAAAMTMLNRLAMNFGPCVRFESEDYIGAPDLKRTLGASDADLRACGLSAAKATALRGCAKWIAEGKIREDELESLPDDEAALRLRRLPGIGPWSAQLILLRGFGRLGNFPAGDSGALRGLREVFASTSDPDTAAGEALARLGAWRGCLYFMLLGRKILGLS